MTHAALKDHEARTEAVRQREKDGCPLARELRVLREMCSCGNDQASVDEAEVRYMELVSSGRPTMPRKVFPQGSDGPAYYVAKDVDAAIAALSAMEGEAVAWQVRFQLDGTSYWSGWETVKSEEAATRAMEQWDRYGVAAERRTLYTAPPPQQAEKCGRCDGTSDPICRRCESEIYTSTHPTPSPGPQGGGEYWLNLYAGDNAENYAYRSKDAAINAGCPEEDGDRIAVHVREVATPPAHQPGEVVTDEMVELGLQAAVEASDARLPRYSVVRAIITAALAPKEAGHE